jgi:hypothetical protein
MEGSSSASLNKMRSVEGRRRGGGGNGRVEGWKGGRVEGWKGEGLRKMEDEGGGWRVEGGDGRRERRRRRRSYLGQKIPRLPQTTGL